MVVNINGQDYSQIIIVHMYITTCMIDMHMVPSVHEYSTIIYHVHVLAMYVHVRSM